MTEYKHIGDITLSVHVGGQPDLLFIFPVD